MYSESFRENRARRPSGILTLRKQIKQVSGGFATPFSRSSGPDGSFRGCIYDADGNKVDLSERFTSRRLKVFPDNPASISLPPENSVRRISGRSLYLGSYMAHYGHFITETLSTFWIFDSHDPEDFDHFVFHPFIFGSKIKPYALRCFACAGIDPDKIIIMDQECLEFEDLVVPERLMRVFVGADRSLRSVTKRISDKVTSDSCTFLPRKLYLSRRKTNFCRNARRIVANEAKIERLFARWGFETIYPEDISFEEQIARYSVAPVIAGLSGSALLNSVFMKEGATLIEIVHPDLCQKDDTMVRTLDMCTGIAGVRSMSIPFQGRSMPGSGLFFADVKHIEQCLSDMKIPGTTSPGPRRWSAAGIFDNLETGYHLASSPLRSLSEHCAKYVNRLRRKVS